MFNGIRNELTVALGAPLPHQLVGAVMEADPDAAVLPGESVQRPEDEGVSGGVRQRHQTPAVLRETRGKYMIINRVCD